MEIYKYNGISNLIDIISAGNFDPSDHGPVVVSVNLGDSRTIQGRYHDCPKEEIDIISIYDFIADNKALLPLVIELLKSNTSFVTETSDDDMVCTLKWTIEGETDSSQKPTHGIKCSCLSCITQLNPLAQA